MIGLGDSSVDHDFYAYNASNEIWNGSTFVTKAAADYLTYRIAATKTSDVDASGQNEWFSATAPSGTVRYEMLIRGASAALSYVVWVDTDSAAIAAVAAQVTTVDTVVDANAAAIATIGSDLDIDGYTLEEAMRIALAALAGKVSGGGTTTNTFKAADDSKARITATVDSDGNRIGITLDAT